MLADDLLVGPAGGDLPGANFRRCRDFTEAFRGLLDDVEDRHAEGLDQLPGVDRADALDHARAEVALDAGQGGRRRDLDEHRAKLPAMFPIGDPAAGSGGVLAGGDGRRVTDQGDQFALTLHLQAKHAKAVLLVVEGDSLNQTGEAVEFGGGNVGHGKRRGQPSDQRRARANQLKTRLQAAFDDARRDGQHEIAGKVEVLNAESRVVGQPVTAGRRGTTSSLGECNALGDGIEPRHIAIDLLAQRQGVAQLEGGSRIRFRATKGIEIGDHNLRLADQVDVRLKDSTGIRFFRIGGQQRLKAMAATGFPSGLGPGQSVRAKHIRAGKVNFHREIVRSGNGPGVNLQYGCYAW